jgi:2-polyprenyl-3-methyl-5-hydroxy-6-metoxy-1,4-benzoquinol methylase
MTEKPYWLDHAYCDATCSMDVSVMRRNISMSDLVTRYICRLFNPNEKFLDFAGGHGVFVRLMRDKGFNFYWYDPYANNLFARGFEDEGDTRYELITAFEVVEHLEKPMDFFEKLFKMTSNVLFSTILIPDVQYLPTQWYYYSLETGQHISFYNMQTLRFIAKQFNRKLFSNGQVHLLTDKNISRLHFKLLTSPKLWLFMKWWYRRPSLHTNDYIHLQSTL